MNQEKHGQKADFNSRDAESQRKTKKIKEKGKIWRDVEKIK
jgi:hypothetical protein